MQVTMPTDGTNPYAWFLVIALGGIAFMFKLYEGSMSKRQERCEKQQDALLADTRAQAATIREQSSVLIQIADLAENAVEGTKLAHQKLDELRRIIEDQKRDAHRVP